MPASWTVLNIGCITRNQYWGERDTNSYRNAYCTSTVIKTEQDIIVVDPSMKGKDMELLLDARCGLTPGDITKVFVTHTHGDHLIGLGCFENAEWFMADKELEGFSKSNEEKLQKLAARFSPASGEISPGIRTIPLPGHTAGLGGLMFKAVEGTVVIAGDAVMTKDFFINRSGYHNSEDFKAAAETIEEIAGIADIVVPGHDNYFLVAAAEKSPKQEIVYTK